MFEFDTDADSDIFRSLSGLIKTNNGQFKSAKQAKFLTKTYRAMRQHDTIEFVKGNFGVEMTEGQYIIFVRAYVRWADYGHDSHRPVSWIFVMDDQGVVGQYKIFYQGTMRKGTSVDASKTKQLWKREGELVPLEIPAEEQPKPSTFIGMVGEKITFKGIVKAVFTFERRKFHYYDSGIGYITKIDVNGNDVVYFGDLAEKGQEVEVKATVKNHDVRDGRCQTIIARPKLVGV